MVPDDYDRIQDAIDAANPEDIIFVKAGTYYENVVVHKSLSLIGEGKETTVIDGRYSGKVVEISADQVIIAGFSVRNSGSNWWSEDGGIILDGVSFCGIYNNLLTNNLFGIRLVDSCNNVIADNVDINNTYGIYVGSGAFITGCSTNNLIIGNIVEKNRFGVELAYHSANNTLRQNIMSLIHITLEYQASTSRISFITLTPQTK